MGGAARCASGHASVTMLADLGCCSRDQVLACEGSGTVLIVPKSDTAGGATRGAFTSNDFIYDAGYDRYACPAGNRLTQATIRSTGGPDPDLVRYHTIDACRACPLKPRCMPTRFKQIKQWRHDSVLDAMQERLEQVPDAM